MLDQIPHPDTLSRADRLARAADRITRAAILAAAATLALHLAAKFAGAY